MNESKLYHLFFDVTLASKEAAFQFVGDSCETSNICSSKIDLIEQLNYRESVGNTLIAEHVLLPHVESPVLLTSKILFLRLLNPIQKWNDQVNDISLIIVILLKDAETLMLKKSISRFVRKLADDEFVENLLAAETKVAFEVILKNIEEEK